MSVNLIDVDNGKYIVSVIADDEDTCKQIHHTEKERLVGGALLKLQNDTRESRMTEKIKERND